MLMWGTYDFRVSDMLETYDTLDAPKYGVEIYHATHFSFADTCSDELDPMCGDDSVLHYHIAHDVINHYATAFLLKYLMGDDRFEAYLHDTSDTLVDYVFDTTIGSGIHASSSIIPDKLNILCYPNPFNAILKIEIAGLAPLDAEGYLIGVEIYDINGRLVYIDKQGCLSVQGSRGEWNTYTLKPSNSSTL
ncbi:T9SS type A sorting domain-containing protein [bacterium]|nr:T9SS type A sorting domain-containing protein [bacterium]